MRLLSVQHAAPAPLPTGSAYLPYHNSAWGYTLLYPASWHRRSPVATQQYWDAGDDNASVLVEEVPGVVRAVTPATIATMLAAAGIPQASPTYRLLISHGHAIVVADALLTAPSHFELQFEVRFITRPYGLLILIGVASPGAEDGSVRIERFAREYEQLQYILDSVRLTTTVPAATPTPPISG
jgi:hypothetical protein